MKTKTQIEIDFAQAKAMAAQLDEIAGNIGKLSTNEFEACIDNTRRHWTGENATNYVAKCELLQNQLDTTKGAISRAAETVRKIAQQLYDAEMQALAIAQARSYT